MGVKTTLTGITFTATGLATAEKAGCDIVGLMNSAEIGAADTIAKLNYLINDVLTPAGTESANIATLQAQITALS